MTTPTFPASSMGEYTIIHTPSASSSLAPTRSLLAMLTHAPAGLFSSRQSRRRKSGRPSPAIKDGVTVTKMFNPRGFRPFPNMTRLDQSVTGTLMSRGGLTTSSVTVPVYAGIYFALNSLEAYGKYTTLFDEYRFEQIEVWIETNNLSEAVTDCQMVSAIDVDDANVPTNVDQISGHPDAVSSSILTGRYHKWKPHTAVAEYSGAFTSFGNQPAGWLDVASPGIQHYGLKIAIPTADGVARSVTYTARATISFRGNSI